MVFLPRRPIGLGLPLFLLTALAAFGAGRAQEKPDPLGGKSRTIERSPIIDGSFVHNVGNLHMNVGNWGFVGSMPKSNYPMGDAPSAQFPAGSGVEYLYAAGIWVGAITNGIPSVSTGYPETEFRPGNDPRATIYRTYEGDLRGRRLPGPADDDGDGKRDEDFLNGYDDDGDGLIDEDFAAKGSQMFSCEYYDDIPTIQLIWPEHRPMGIRIRQETFQWGEDVFNDFVCASYNVTNMGNNYLEDMYVGIYADLDAGPRDIGTYYMDDKVGYWEGSKCVLRGDYEYPVRLKLAYVYDNDGDGGRTPGYFAIVLLGYTTTVNGDFAPQYPSYDLVTFKTFRGLQPYVDGGDATNDFERYEAISTYTRDPDAEDPGDYRVLISTGPFPYLAPGMSIDFAVAFVAGEDFDSMLENAAYAKLVYDGVWYDLDGQNGTGILGRESPVAGPLKEVDPDVCDGIDEAYSIQKGQVLWCNLDCALERQAFNDRTCYKSNKSLSYYQTGTDGKEYQLHWVTGSAPPPPHIRAIAGDHRVTLFWDDISETTPDPVTLMSDFEGYRIFRAEDWHRPLGSSEVNGPELDLWTCIETRDVVNSVPPNVAFNYSYDSGGWIYTPLAGLPDRDQYISLFESALASSPGDTVPCPEGLDCAVCDTLEAIARKNINLEGGRRYYKFVDDYPKNGMPYFYSVAPYDHEIRNGTVVGKGRYNSPSANFVFLSPNSTALDEGEYSSDGVIVVPNPVTAESMAPWTLGPTNDDPTGLKVEIRNLPRCRSTIRIFTVSGDLVKVLHHDGSDGNGTVEWNLVSRNGQDIVSGVYLFAVEPESKGYARAIGKFVVIR